MSLRPPFDRATDPGRVAVPANLCDWCGLPLGSSWRRYECEDFSRTMRGQRGELPVSFLGFWAACSPCSPFVDDRRWRQLIDRVLPIYEKRSGRMGPRLRSVFRSELTATYLQLERALTGTAHDVDLGAKR